MMYELFRNVGHVEQVIIELWCLGCYLL